jgi:ribosomal 30S subunit maturation factor RimM
MRIVFVLLKVLPSLLLVQVTESFLLPSTCTFTCAQSIGHFQFALPAVADEPETSTGTNSKRRKKKNKYANFSKTDKMNVDPFEALVSESEEKNKTIKTEVAKKKNQKVEWDEETMEAMKMEKRDRDKRLFPDNRTIDPYDPSTYGYTELGTILGAHGVHGLMKISAVTEFSERLCKPGIRHLKSPSRRSPREIRLLEGRLRLKNEYLIKLEGVSDRNEALKLRKSVLYARQEERPEDMDENDYLVSELVGLDVHLVTGYGEDDDDDDDIKEEDDTDRDDAISVEGGIDSDNDNNNNNSVSGKFVGILKGVVLAEEMCTTPGLGQDLLEIVLPRGRNGSPSWKDEMILIPFVPSIVPTVDIEKRMIYIDPPAGLLDLTYIKEEFVRIKGFLPETSSYEKNKNK